MLRDPLSRGKVDTEWIRLRSQADFRMRDPGRIVDNEIGGRDMPTLELLSEPKLAQVDRVASRIDITRETSSAAPHVRQFIEFCKSLVPMAAEGRRAIEEDLSRGMEGREFATAFEQHFVNLQRVRRAMQQIAFSIAK